MRLPDFELASPTTVADACKFLKAGRDEAQVLAGGTDLMVALKERQKQPRVVVDLAGIEGLNGIAYSPEAGLEIGALVTLGRLATDPVIAAHYPVLAEAALQVATPQIRSVATVGGNLCQDSCCMYFNRPEEVRRALPPCHKLGGCVCHVVQSSPKCWAPYAGDMAPTLMAIGASATVAEQSGERSIPVGDIYRDEGARPVVLKAGQLITKIKCPTPPPRSGAAYVKLRARETLDYAVAAVAASVTLSPEDDTCARMQVVLTGVASCPMAVPEAADLKGGPVTDAAIDKLTEAAALLSYPVKNVVGSEPAYRRRMVRLAVEKALRQALRLAGAIQGEPA